MNKELIKIKPELTIVDYTEKFQNPINLECTTTEQVSERLNAAMSKIQKDIEEDKPVKKYPNPDIPEDELVTMQQINKLTNE